MYTYACNQRSDEILQKTAAMAAGQYVPAGFDDVNRGYDVDNEQNASDDELNPRPNLIRSQRWYAAQYD